MASLHSLALLSCLLDLSLEHCQLDCCPPAVLQLLQLRRLDLSHNQLSDLPATLLCQPGQQNSTLATLNLSHNRLKKFPPCILALVALAELYVNHNAIEYVPQEVSTLVALQTVDISNNAIKSVPHGWTFLRYFKL